MTPPNALSDERVRELRSDSASKAQREWREMDDENRRVIAALCDHWLESLRREPGEVVDDDVLWARGYSEGNDYSVAGDGGPKDSQGQSLTNRETRIFAEAWRRGYKSALASSQAGKCEWQPIETAPKDAEVLLGWWSTWPSLAWQVAAGLAGSKKGGWIHGHATHWQPLPPRPTQARKMSESTNTLIEVRDQHSAQSVMYRAIDELIALRSDHDRVVAELRDQLQAAQVAEAMASDDVKALAADARRWKYVWSHAVPDENGYTLPYIDGWIGKVPREWATLDTAIDAALSAKEAKHAFSQGEKG